MEGEENNDVVSVSEENKNSQNITEQDAKVTIEEEFMDNYKGNEGKGKKKHSLRFKIIVSCASVLLAVILGAGGYLWHVMGYINHKDFSKVQVSYQPEEFDTDGNKESYEEIDPEKVIWQKYGEIKKVEGITNILLCAEENQDGGKRGRTDVIMLATIDTNTDTLKLTSIMRDTYVQIPGFKDNKINTAYRVGDIPLLEQTIKENFNIEVDGYVKVDFDSFTNIIDSLGGVEVTLTEKEAEWLNQSNHILDKNSRNLTAGTQVLNGSQALGYSRIRKVPTADGIGSDFGRVWRQKHVLMQVFNKYKNQSLLDILGKAPDILRLIQTDYTRTEVLSLIKTVMDMRSKEINTLSIPIKHAYEPKKIRGMDVLLIDRKMNNEALSNFIFNTNTESVADTNGSISSGQKDSTYN